MVLLFFEDVFTFTKKIMKKLIALVIITCLYGTTALNAQKKMAIGYAYENMSSPCGQFTTAKGYRYETSSSNDITLGNLRQKVTDELANYYSVSKNNVMVWTSTKNYGCVISYRKKISGWDCTKFAYAVSFGNTESEARENALREMRLYYDGSSYTVERIIE
jgi:hypothetical protein